MSPSPTGRRSFPTSPSSTSIRAPDPDSLLLYALMEGPSIVGAYRFVMTRGKGVVMDIQSSLFVRAQSSRFGIAPCTSMYWYSETKKETAIDWRPEVHDSDGLEMWSGNGERLWRALNNPPRIMVSSFLDDNPRGFGLMPARPGVRPLSRRRQLRPQAQPLGRAAIGARRAGWGKGSIQLCEIPTDDEIHDNVVAMWVPAQPVPAGAEIHLNYKLYWLANEPDPPRASAGSSQPGSGAAASPASRGPRGCASSWSSSSAARSRRCLTASSPNSPSRASRGVFGPYQLIEAVPDGVTGHWRAQFDLIVEGPDPVEMRAFLKSGDQPMTETWLFQYHPF